MGIFLTIVHVVVCIGLIMIVLLQTGKGADMGAAFGGGSSQTLFGSSGASTFLSKATTIAAVIFMLTSLTLAYVVSNKIEKSIMLDTKAPIEEQTKPVEPQDEIPAPVTEPAEPVIPGPVAEPSEQPINAE